MGDGMGGLIAAVRAGSIASDLGLEPGDRVYGVGGSLVRDYIDYRFLTAEALVELEVIRQDGSWVVFEIEKDEDDDLGIEFATDIFPPDRVRTCGNRCLFCFVDRLPPGLRPALYVKDDDYRLSFLHGNFVTLTNLTPADESRILAQRLSPLYVSVHSTEPELRSALLGRELAVPILERLRRLSREGIVFHAQIVVCPGLNDGPELDRTIRDLAELRPGVSSVGVVPVGLTRYGPKGSLARTASPLEERKTLDQLLTWHEQLGGFVYPADEYFLRTGAELPPARFYGTFPQLQNGIGLARRFLDDLARLEDEARPAAAQARASRLRRGQSQDRRQGFVAVTGSLARPLLELALGTIEQLTGLDGELVEVANRTLGPGVTVAGLLFGQDVLEAVRRAGTKERSRTGAADLRPVLVPGSALRAGSDEFLDGATLTGLSESMGRPFLDAGWLPRQMLATLEDWRQGP